MEGLGVLLVVVAVFLANLPALREQWRTDRAASIKTIWMLGRLLSLCRARDSRFCFLLSAKTCGHDSEGKALTPHRVRRWT